MIEFQKCLCGAITFYEENVTYSCKQSNIKKFFPNMDLRRIKRLNTTCNCNHCVNHYGLDLCGCGSGEKFGKCKEGFPDCEYPMQTIEGGRLCLV